MKESQIERRLAEGVEKLGGLCPKFQGGAGWPDRVAVLPGGRVAFVELKTGAGRLARLQRWQMGRLRAIGADARVLRGMEEVEAFLEEAKGGMPK